MTAKAEDGRVARGRRTREAVIDALLGLNEEGNLSPTIEQIAARVEMTTRSIYHHFQDREALAAAVGGRQLERHARLFDARKITGTLEERIAGIVAHRVELYETIAPARRATVIRLHASPELQAQQAFLAVHLRRHLTKTFAPELSTLDRSTKSATLELLDLHTSWDTWERLRRGQRLSVPRSRKLVTQLVTQALNRQALNRPALNTSNNGDPA